MLKNSSLISLVFILTSLLTWVSVNSQYPCTNFQDCETNFPSQGFSKCVDEFCACHEYFYLGYDPEDPESDIEKCLLKTPYGETCFSFHSCRNGPMGQHSTCNSSKLCQCESHTEKEVVLLEGICTLVMKLEETCTEDIECRAGVNEFAACNNGTCGCLSNEFATFVPDGQGNCGMEVCSENSCVDISVFAATMAGSAALLVLIVVIYRLTNPNRVKIPKTSSPTQISSRVSIQPIDTLQASSSTKVDIP